MWTHLIHVTVCFAIKKRCQIKQRNEPGLLYKPFGVRTIFVFLIAWKSTIHMKFLVGSGFTSNSIQPTWKTNTYFLHTCLSVCFDVALVSSRQLPVGSVSSAPPHTVHVCMFIVHCSAHRSLPQRDRICVLCIFRCYGSARALVFVSQWPIWRSPCEPRWVRSTDLQRRRRSLCVPKYPHSLRGRWRCIFVRIDAQINSHSH